MRYLAGLTTLMAVITFSGCTGDVTTTDDSVKMEAEVPRVEVGSEPVDMNPATDNDVDIDTPIKGDS